MSTHIHHWKLEEAPAEDSFVGHCGCGAVRTFEPLLPRAATNVRLTDRFDEARTKARQASTASRRPK